MKIKPVRSNDGYRVAIGKADLESLTKKYLLAGSPKETSGDSSLVN